MNTLLYALAAVGIFYYLKTWREAFRFGRDGAYVEYQRARALGGRVIESGERTGVHATGTTTVGPMQARIAHE